MSPNLNIKNINEEPEFEDINLFDFFTDNDDFNEIYDKKFEDLELSIDLSEISEKKETEKNKTTIKFFENNLFNL